MAEDKQNNTNNTKTNIGESIGELESLITKTEILSKSHKGTPVLNDIVNPDEVEKYTKGKSPVTPKITINNNEDIHFERLNELVDTVDRKLLSELDSLVDIFKNTIKNSIINELKEDLKKEAAQIKLGSASEINLLDKTPK